MHANKREDIKEIEAAATSPRAAGLRVTATGDTLCDAKRPILLELMEFPEPVISHRHRARRRRPNQDKLALALEKLAIEDPSFRVRTDAETGQTLISGMGELHLEIIVDRLRREFKVEAYVGKPQVAYRETITAAPTPRTSSSARRAAAAQYGHVVLRVEPTAGRRHRLRESTPWAAACPREFVPAVERGVRESLERGVMAGYPMIDVEVELVGGSYHEVDSSEMAFEIAGSMALRRPRPARPRPCCSSRS